MLHNNNTIFKQKSKINLKENLSFSSIILSFAIIVVMLLILFSPVKYANSVIKGLKLFFVAVLPGLLPFMFLTKILTNLNIISKLTKPLNRPMQKCFGLNGESFYAFIMSIISGYPIGSKITADLYEQQKITNSELLKTALLSSTSGPIFVIGAVGATMFNSAKIGFVIYLSNIIASVLLVAIMNMMDKIKIKSKKTALQSSNITNNNPQIKPKQNMLSQAASDTVLGLLIVGFYIAIFTLFIDLLTNLHIINFLSKILGAILSALSIKSSIASGVMSGIIEMTNGAKILSNTPDIINICSASFVISFSGLSILLQSLSFLSKTQIKTHKFILYKFMGGIISFIVCYSLSVILL